MMLFAAVSVAACSKAGETAPPEAASGQATAQSIASTPHTGRAGNAVTTGVPLPVDFPEDLWVPASGMIVQASTSETTASLTMTVSTIPEQLANDALAAMTSSGWQQQDRRTNPQGMQQIKFVKDNRLATYSAHLAHDKAGSVLSVRLSPANR